MKHLRTTRSRTRLLIRVVIGCYVVGGPLPAVAPAQSPHGRLEHEIVSEFSHIRIRKRGSIRSLIFVRDDGEEKLETQMDLRKPHELRFAYTRYMFLSYVVRPRHERVLLVGLGGGSMVHFLRHYDPDVFVDAVDIDPEVVRIADEYFDMRSEGRVTVAAADGFEYLERAQDARYDVIYLDAFLKPSAQTDTTGAPLRLRTLQFYETLKNKLTATGLVVFNLNPHRTVKQDVDTIRDAFGQTYVFTLPRRAGLVVVADKSRTRLRNSVMARRASELDQRFKTSFSFRPMVRGVRR